MGANEAHGCKFLKHFINVTLGDSTVKFKSRLFVFFKITIKLKGYNKKSFKNIWKHGYL